jgi:AraC-like DNA-binding protein
LAADPLVAATGVGGIARRLHLSERQLRRIVRAHFGVTPSEFLRDQRREQVA